jgi:hypothetical protein
MRRSLAARTALRFGFTFVGLSIVLSPLLIGQLRLVAFKTVPGDDYAPYLLYLLGHPEGVLVDAPWAYRFLSVLAVAPFMALPRASFSLLAQGSPAYLSALQALTVFSFLCMVATICTAGYIAVRRFGCGPLGVVGAGVIAFVACQHTAIHALDMPTILLISLGVLTLGSLGSFAALMLASAFANEKVLLVFGLLFLARVASNPAQWRQYLPRLVPVIVGSIAYVIVAKVMALPTPAHQTGLMRIFDTIQANFEASLTVRGLLLNVLPVVLATALALLARSSVRPEHAPYAARSDSLVLVGLLGAGLVATLDVNVGRIVMHAFPLFVGPAALHLEASQASRLRVA